MAGAGEYAGGVAATASEGGGREEIVVSNRMPQSVLDALERRFTVHRLWEAADREALLSEIAPRIRAAATSGGANFGKDTIHRLPNLAMIASFGVGYDGIDTEDCRARGIRVTNTPDVLNDAMAEITLGLMIALARRIPQADAYVREGRWTGGNFPLTAELTGRTVGIVGLGRIGKEVARRCQAFRMQVVYHGRSRQADEPYPYYADLVEMAGAVDWLVSIVPGGPSTKGILGAAVFEALGPEGHFVNVGRGPSVDEPALIEALTAGRIAGAALDVFADEPNVPEALRRLDNVVLSPHQGSATHRTRRAMGDLVVRNLLAWADRRPLLTPVV
jgi:lactate dehydrogenase-like 2-hydroxyacid dehydrogenase